MIKITNLNKIYNKGKRNEHHALRDVNLEIGNTGLVCILGESGSGKTTLLNTIGGLDTYSGGTIEVDEKEDYGYIFQNYYLLNDYTVSYNVKLALNRYQISDEEKEKRVEYVLDMLDMGKYKKKPVSKLSGGQKQRVSIARALVKSPTIIFADEPTGNLDEENTIRTMSILKSISKNCLVLLVTHERRIANFFADRIIEVEDGRIIKDSCPVSGGSYTRSDDANLYLKEFRDTSLEDAHARFNLYYRDALPEKIHLNIAFLDGRLYIQNLTPCEIVLAGKESGVEMIDDVAPTFEMEDVDKLAYQLERLPDKGSARLSGREIRHMAKENLRMMGKKQSFILAIFLVAAILLTVTLAQFVSTKSVDEDKIVTSDSHYLSLYFEKVSSVRGEENQLKILEFAKRYFHDESLGEVLYVPSQNLYMKAAGLAQMENLTQIVNNFTYADVNLLTDKEIIYGRLPQNRTEVVVDKRVLQGIMDSGRVVSSMYSKMEDYLGIHFCILTHDTELTIVGISDTGEPDIYASRNVLLGLESKGYNVASEVEYEAVSGEKISLSDDEIYMREGMFHAYYGEFDPSQPGVEYFGDTEDYGKKIVGLIPDAYGIDYVGNDNVCLELRDIMIYYDKKAALYADNVEEAVEKLTEYAKDYEKAFRLEITVLHEDQIREYMENSTVDFNAVNLISAIVVVISLMMIYFTMKSNVVARMEELTVYRLLGISKGSILKSYMLEMGILTTVTSLPAVLLTTGVMKFIGDIPSLKTAFYFPWGLALGLIAVIYMVHILISILPVYGLLSKPPATLALKG